MSTQDFMYDGRWKMYDGRWKMEDVRCKMAEGTYGKGLESLMSEV